MSQRVMIGQDENGKHHMSSPIVASGRKTDSALTDNFIDTSGFNYITVVNEGTTELTLAIDEPAVAATKPIYLPASGSFSNWISGSSLHYTGAVGTTNFRYLLC